MERLDYQKKNLNTTPPKKTLFFFFSWSMAIKLFPSEVCASLVLSQLQSERSCHRTVVSDKSGVRNKLRDEWILHNKLDGLGYTWTYQKIPVQCVSGFSSRKLIFSPRSCFKTYFRSYVYVGKQMQGLTYAGHMTHHWSTPSVFVFFIK